MEGYKLIQVTHSGECRETTASGWNAETMMDRYFHQCKEDKRTKYCALFYLDNCIRSEYIYLNNAKRLQTKKQTVSFKTE